MLAIKFTVQLSRCEEYSIDAIDTNTATAPGIPRCLLLWRDSGGRFATNYEHAANLIFQEESLRTQNFFQIRMARIVQALNI